MLFTEKEDLSPVSSLSNMLLILLFVIIECNVRLLTIDIKYLVHTDDYLIWYHEKILALPGFAIKLSCFGGVY